MYTVRRTKQFERSFKRISRSGVKSKIKKEVAGVIDLIASGRTLAAKYKDHKLTGDHAQYRECHIRPDLLLIYYIEKEILVLVLFDIGSHAQLFG